jgi:type I restriction enzyme S subunit
VPEFIYWALESQNILKQISNTVHTTSQPAFGMEKIRNLLIVFPGENERQTISQILNKQNSTIKEFKLNLSKLQSLKTGLMQDLLSGKVRVTEEILIN